MSWTSAGWLAGLVPWAAVAAYLFTGTNRPVAVPFVHLWPRATGGARRRRGWRRPPVGLVLAAAGVAAAVVSAGGPGRRGGRLPVTVVLDRGATMCGAAGDAAYRGVVRRARATLGDAPARLVCVPAVAGGPTIVTDDWADRAASAPPTAADTAAALDAAVGDLLRSPGDGSDRRADRPTAGREGPAGDAARARPAACRHRGDGRGSPGRDAAAGDGARAEPVAGSGGGPGPRPVGRRRGFPIDRRGAGGDGVSVRGRAGARTDRRRGGRSEHDRRGRVPRPPRAADPGRGGRGRGRAAAADGGRVRPDRRADDRTG